MSVTAAAATLAPVELPLLTFQLLTQLQYDRDTFKTYYESCNRDLDLHKEKSAKEAERWQQTTCEHQSEVAVLSARAQSAVEAKSDLELQLQAVRGELKTAQERLGALETLFKQNNELSDNISLIWSGIMRIIQSTEASQAILLETKENLTAMSPAEDIAPNVSQIEVMHNNTKLLEPRCAAEQLLDRVKSLEDDVENRSRVINTYEKYLQNLTLILDGLLKEHSNIATAVKDHKSEILRMDTSLSNIFDNFTSSYQKDKEDKLLQEKLQKLLDGKSKEERLLEAAKSGNVEEISLLLHFGADTEARDSSGNTALHLAAWYGHLNASKVLLDGGARMDQVTPAINGNTPLHLAAQRNDLDMVRFFVERGANLMTKNRYGYTPLQTARANFYQPVIKYLEEKGATV